MIANNSEHSVFCEFYFPTQHCLTVVISIRPETTGKSCFSRLSLVGTERGKNTLAFCKKKKQNKQTNKKKKRKKNKQSMNVIKYYRFLFSYSTLQAQTRSRMILCILRHLKAQTTEQALLTRKRVYSLLTGVWRVAHCRPPCQRESCLVQVRLLADLQRSLLHG